MKNKVCYAICAIGGILLSMEAYFGFIYMLNSLHSFMFVTVLMTMIWIKNTWLGYLLKNKRECPIKDEEQLESITEGNIMLSSYFVTNMILIIIHFCNL